MSSLKQERKVFLRREGVKRRASIFQKFHGGACFANVPFYPLHGSDPVKRKKKSFRILFGKSTFKLKYII